MVRQLKNKNGKKKAIIRKHLSLPEKEINLEIIEKKLSRKINIMTIEYLDKLDKNIREKIYNGAVLSGEI